MNAVELESDAISYPLVSNKIQVLQFFHEIFLSQLKIDKSVKPKVATTTNQNDVDVADQVEIKVEYTPYRGRIRFKKSATVVSEGLSGPFFVESF